MPGTTLANLRNELGRTMGFYETFETSTDIAANQLVVSNPLRNKGYGKDDVLNRKWLYIRGTNNANISKPIDDYAGTSGTITVGGPALASETASVACDIYLYHPTRMTDAINQARLDAYPHLYVPIQNEYLVTGYRQHVFTLPSGVFTDVEEVRLASIIDAVGYGENIINDLDPGMENPTGSNWTLAGTGATVNKEEVTTTPRNYMVLTGQSSARILSASSGVATFLATVTNGGNYNGEELNHYVWVYCTVSGRVSAQIDMDGNTSEGSTHQGNGWEKLPVGKILTAVTTLKVGVHVTAGTVITFYIDNVVAVAGPSEIAEGHYQRLYNWQYYPPRTTATNGYLTFPYELPAQRTLRIFGRDYLTSVSAEADQMEVDLRTGALLLAHARKWLYQWDLNGSMTDGPVALRQRKLNNAEREIERMQYQAVGMPLRPQFRSWPGWTL